MMTAMILLVTGSMGLCEDISLTVYNNDLGVVKVADTFAFVKGEQTMRYTGVADKIDPTSVRFKALQGSFTVLEQNYRYDLVNSYKVLARYIDRKITLFLTGGEMIEGSLQSVQGDIVLKDASGLIKIVRMNTIERYELPELPEGLITRPTLVWKVDSKKQGKADAEISYLSSGLSWHAEYSAVISDDEESLELSSWVSVDNTSGSSYDNAKLKLVAGDINRARKPVRPRTGRAKMMLAEDSMAGAPFEERGLFEYHLYELQDRTDIANAEIKQVSLFTPATTNCEKKFMYDSWVNDKKVAVKMEFVNSRKAGLGMPLPKGVVRVYKADEDGGLELIGEDNIDHTPKNEKVILSLGNAFDIVAERKLEKSLEIARNLREDMVSVTLRNRKEESVEVTVTEHLSGTWEITETSHDYVQKDAHTATFTVSVPPDGETTMRYVIRIR